jgi:hypothetical protein
VAGENQQKTHPDITPRSVGKDTFFYIQHRKKSSAYTKISEKMFLSDISKNIIFAG